MSDWNAFGPDDEPAPVLEQIDARFAGGHLTIQLGDAPSGAGTVLVAVSIPGADRLALFPAEAHALAEALHRVAAAAEEVQP